MTNYLVTPTNQGQRFAMTKGAEKIPQLSIALFLQEQVELGMKMDGRDDRRQQGQNSSAVNKGH